MTYDENVFKEKANRKARKIWIIFAVLLSANYGSDAAGGLYPQSYTGTIWLSATVFSIPLSYARRNPPSHLPISCQ